MTMTFGIQVTPFSGDPKQGNVGNFGPLWEEVKNNMSQSFGIYLLIWRDQAQQEEWISIRSMIGGVGSKVTSPCVSVGRSGSRFRTSSLVAPAQFRPQCQCCQEGCPAVVSLSAGRRGLIVWHGLQWLGVQLWRHSTNHQKRAVGSCCLQKGTEKLVNRLAPTAQLSEPQSLFFTMPRRWNGRAPSESIWLRWPKRIVTQISWPQWQVMSPSFPKGLMGKSTSSSQSRQAQTSPIIGDPKPIGLRLQIPLVTKARLGNVGSIGPIHHQPCGYPFKTCCLGHIAYETSSIINTP